jgi:tetrapyrrole methylase family protein/MazG family protein
MGNTQKRADPSGFEQAYDVVERLRGEDGCPWDREQTLETLKPYLVEECYELLEALDSGDPDCHKEELGDVLLQVLLQSRIRQEQGEFEFDDVARSLSTKLIRRHPHVFGDVNVANSDEVVRNWDAIKANEKGCSDASVLDGVPLELPALQRAQRIQSRVSRVGFDWDNVEPVLEKIVEELAETKEAIASGSPERVRDEIGDLLFSIVNLCRLEKVNADDALRHATRKFIMRFQEVERRLRAKGMGPSDVTLAELDAHWEHIKQEEGVEGQ